MTQIMKDLEASRGGAHRCSVDSDGAKGPERKWTSGGMMMTQWHCCQALVWNAGNARIEHSGRKILNCHHGNTRRPQCAIDKGRLGREVTGQSLDRFQCRESDRLKEALENWARRAEALVA